MCGTAINTDHFTNAKVQLAPFIAATRTDLTGRLPAVDELKLVVWPSRQQLFSESIAVILMVSLSAATIAAVSRFFGWASSQVFR